MEKKAKFVIQKHNTPDGTHWDLMLEQEDTLQTYRLELPPEKLSQQKTAAVKISDHPLKFLTYEGSVNKGKGSVETADTGTYQIIDKAENETQFQFDGKILKGKFTLRHIENDKWQFSSTAGI